jgi:SET domain-containing protein
LVFFTNINFLAIRFLRDIAAGEELFMDFGLVRWRQREDKRAYAEYLCSLKFTKQSVDRMMVRWDRCYNESMARIKDCANKIIEEQKETTQGLSIDDLFKQDD